MHAPETLSADRRELFGIRVERWLPDLRAGLRELYPAPDADALERRLLDVGPQPPAAVQPG